MLVRVGGSSHSFDTQFILCRIILKTSHQGGGASAAAPGSARGGLWRWEARPPQRPGQADTDSQIQTAHCGGDREGGAGVDVHPAGLNSFQCPSEMTSTPPPVTLMAV